jgi:LuxR family maltose regulon positive regulatory protein
MIESLLTTKLYIPPPHPSLVPRPRLIRQLDEGLRLGHRLTVVSAPAGYGKTALLSEWAARCARPVAWISLDQGDSELRRFLAYLIGALRTLPHLADAGVGRSIAVVLHSPNPEGAAPALSVEPLLTDLINEIAAAPGEPFLLILDDLHLIDDRTVHTAIRFFLDNLPPSSRAMHLVLASRTDPPWPLARLRARDEITEVRANDLRFTTDEAMAFLSGTGTANLSAKDVAVLWERTEGWIAGLQMAAISLQGRKRSSDVNRFIETFRGTHRFILDYLLEEVLGQQSPATREFLIQTSILERMTGPLCDAVRLYDAKSWDHPKGRDAGDRWEGGPDGRALLTQLERANLFVMPLDNERQWYRYHTLFADLLQSTLRQGASPEQIQELYRRASQWHQEHGFLEEAVKYALAAQDYDRAVSILEQNLLAILYRSGTPTFLGWLDQLPKSLIDDHPWMDIYRAWTLAHTSQLEDAEALLQDVEKRVPPDGPESLDLLGSIAASRAYMANLLGELGRALELAQLANDQLLEDNLRVRASVAYTLADTCFALDDMEGAGRAWSQMIDLGRRADRSLLTLPAMCNLANVKKVQGHLCEANGLYEAVHQLMLEQDALDSRVRMSYEIGLSDLLYEWNELETARDRVMVGIEHCQRFGVYITHKVLGHIVLMRVLQAQGDTSGALDALHKAEEVANGSRIQRGTMLQLETWRVRQWLATGDLEAATRWVDESAGHSEVELIAQARVRLAQRRTEQTLQLLDQLEGVTRADGRTGRLIEVLILTAVALSQLSADRAGPTALPGQARGRRDAVAVLAQALALAEPEGYVRLFIDEGEPIENPLRQAAARGIALDYVGRLLDALRREQALRSLGPSRSSIADMVVDPMTKRELEVLRLLATGVTNKEIAQTLVIAISTVKQHLKNIYGKLDVHSRTQAVARAQELDLL